MNIEELQHILDKSLANSIGMDLIHDDEGFSLERLYQIAGKEDRVITVSFRKGSISEHIWGDTLTCCLMYSERERLQLQTNIERNRNNYGKAKNQYLLYDLPEELVEKLRKEGFDSKDVVEVIIAPLLSTKNIYCGKQQRELNTIEIQLDSYSDLDELMFLFNALEHFHDNGMIFTPAELDDYTALRLVLGVQLSEEEKKDVFDDKGRIYNNNVSRLYLRYKGCLKPLSEEKHKQQLQLEIDRIAERMSLLDAKLSKH